MLRELYNDIHFEDESTDMKLIKQGLLIEIIKNRQTLKDNLVLYVDRTTKWNSSSKAYVYEFDEEESIPLDLNGAPYFLELGLIREVIDVWHQWNDKKDISTENECIATIYYAENDSYMAALH
jgi:hypothetical protein